MQFTIPSKAEKDTESSSPHFEWLMQLFYKETLKDQNSLVPNNAKQALLLFLKIILSMSIYGFFVIGTKIKGVATDYILINQSRHFVASIKKIITSIIILY